MHKPFGTGHGDTYICNPNHSTGKQRQKSCYKLEASLYYTANSRLYSKTLPEKKSKQKQKLMGISSPPSHLFMSLAWFFSLGLLGIFLLIFRSSLEIEKISFQHSAYVMDIHFQFISGLLARFEHFLYKMLCFYLIKMYQFLFICRSWTFCCAKNVFATVRLLNTCTVFLAHSLIAEQSASVPDWQLHVLWGISPCPQPRPLILAYYEQSWLL